METAAVVDGRIVGGKRSTPAAPGEIYQRGEHRKGFGSRSI